MSRFFAITPLLALAAAFAFQGASASEGSLLTASICQHTRFNALEKTAELTAFKINGIDVVLLIGDENPISGLAWKSNGEVELITHRGARSPLGKGSAIKLRAGRLPAKKCQDLELLLPADEFEVTAKYHFERAQDGFCGNIHGYSGPCKIREGQSYATLLIEKTGEHFALHSTYQYVQTSPRAKWVIK
jgi:hypothetical protein